ncbi:MAG: hypothetical protein ABIV06_11950 [Thermoanaerobaculia bacterium]
MSVSRHDLPIRSLLSDTEIDRALRALPREAAGRDFCAIVLGQAEAAKLHRTRRRRRAASWAAGVVVLLVGVGAIGLETARNRAERRTALVDEQRRLRSELEELRELAARRTQIRLGGDGTTDLYIDLANVPAKPESVTVQPEKIRTRSLG